MTFLRDYGPFTFPGGEAAAAGGAEGVGGAGAGYELEGVGSGEEKEDWIWMLGWWMEMEEVIRVETEGEQRTVEQEECDGGDRSHLVSKGKVGFRDIESTPN